MMNDFREPLDLNEEPDSELGRQLRALQPPPQLEMRLLQIPVAEEGCGLVVDQAKVESNLQKSRRRETSGNLRWMLAAAVIVLLAIGSWVTISVLKNGQPRHGGQMSRNDPEKRSKGNNEDLALAELQKELAAIESEIEHSRLQLAMFEQTDRSKRLRELHQVAQANIVKPQRESFEDASTAAILFQSAELSETLAEGQQTSNPHATEQFEMIVERFAGTHWAELANAKLD